MKVKEGIIRNVLKRLSYRHNAEGDYTEALIIPAAGATEADALPDSGVAFYKRTIAALKKKIPFIYDDYGFLCMGFMVNLLRVPPLIGQLDNPAKGAEGSGIAPYGEDDTTRFGLSVLASMINLNYLFWGLDYHYKREQNCGNSVLTLINVALIFGTTILFKCLTNPLWDSTVNTERERQDIAISMTTLSMGLNIIWTGLLVGMYRNSTTSYGKLKRVHQEIQERTKRLKATEEEGMEEAGVRQALSLERASEEAVIEWDQLEKESARVLTHIRYMRLTTGIQIVSSSNLSVSLGLNAIDTAYDLQSAGIFIYNRITPLIKVGINIASFCGLLVVAERQQQSQGRCLGRLWETCRRVTYKDMINMLGFGVDVVSPVPVMAGIKWGILIKNKNGRQNQNRIVAVDTESN